MEGYLCLAAIVLLAVPAAAIMIALAARAEVDRLRAQVDGLQARLNRINPPDSERPTAIAPDFAATWPDAPAEPAAEMRPPDGVTPAPPPPPPIVPPIPLWSPRRVQLPGTFLSVAPPAAPASTAPVTPPAMPPEIPEKSEEMGLEAAFTTRIAAWLGAIALFLAGAFLVKWTFDAGLLGPGTRCILGAIFGGTLIAGGEWMRRRDARVAQGLVAAGVATLYAVTLAALNLYHFLGTTLAFVLLAAITGAAIGLSLRHGPFVALLGLIGGFATPALIGSEEPRAAPLFGYFLILQVGLTIVARRRGWQPLAILALAAGVLWNFLWLGTNYSAHDSVWLGSFLLGSLAVFATALRGRQARPGDLNDLRHVEPLAGGTLILAGMLALVHTGNYSLTEWGFLGLLGVGAMILARLDLRHEPLAWLAAGSTAALLAVWHDAPGPDKTALPWLLLAFGILFGGGSYAALWGSPAPLRWALLSCLSAIAALLLAYAMLPHPPAGVPWGLICVLLTAAYAAGVAPLLREARRARVGDGTLAALLVAATSFLSLAIPIEFDRQLIPVGWALEAPALALLFLWLRVNALRVLAFILTALAIIALVRIDVLTLPVGPTLVWNWLLYAYGLPLLAFAAAATVLHRAADVPGSRIMQGAAALVSVALVTLQVRHVFHRDVLFTDTSSVSLAEVATYINAWLLLVLAFNLAVRGWTAAVALGAMRVLSAMALAAAGLCLLLTHNPLFRSEWVGPLPIVNLLLAMYGLPALLFFVVGRIFARRGLLPDSMAAGSAAMVLLFALVSLEVRQGFHGAFLSGGPLPVSLTEVATYINAWLVLAVLLIRFAVRGWFAVIALSAARALTAVALAAAALGLLLTHNPLLRPEWVGPQPILNLLLVTYGLPALLFVVLGRALARRSLRPESIASGIAALVLFFALVSLEVRQWFHGEFLHSGRVENAESYAYSAAWVALGLLLLAVGIFTRSAIVRTGSLVVMLLAVGKVFLLDTSHLRDLYRVFSLLGLGLSLMLLAYVYRRFVFRDRPAPH